MIAFGEGRLSAFAGKYAGLIGRRDGETPAYRYGAGARVARLRSSLHELPPTSTPMRTALLGLRLEEILLHVLEVGGGDFPGRRRASSPTDLLDAVVERYRYERLGVGELAHLCYMSAATFKRQFKERYATPPAAYFRRARLERAAKRLRTGEARPSEVYEAAGFATPSGFAESFKAAFGVSPGDYN